MKNKMYFCFNCGSWGIPQTKNNKKKCKICKTEVWLKHSTSEITNRKKEN